mmetsp:Transcript_11058/g.22832  ORF Transcript_11058/g.22832 Transcript_11058/m.22832 type:complete len:212 (-) Transcript_11058:428-1063(-)
MVVVVGRRRGRGLPPSALSPSVSLEGEILRVEVVDAHVAILAAAREAPPVGVEHERVHGPEVTLHVADLRLEDLVVEQRLELAAAARRRRHFVRRLAARHHNVVHERGDGGAVNGAVCLVGLDRLQRRRVVQRGAHVLGCCDEGHLIEREGDIRDAHLRVSALVNALALLYVIAQQPPAVRASDDALVAWAPQRTVRPRHAIVHFDFLDWL